MADEIESRERQLKRRLEKIQSLEKEVQEKEKALKIKEKAKKQILLRLAPALWEELAAWAEEDYRSINGQIEYLLTECVRQRRKKSDIMSCRFTDFYSFKRQLMQSIKLK